MDRLGLDTGYFSMPRGERYSHAIARLEASTGLLFFSGVINLRAMYGAHLYYHLDLIDDDLQGSFMLFNYK